MRVIIAGSRTITDMDIVERAIEHSGFDIDIVVCGDARGVDALATKWAMRDGNPVGCVIYPANWSMGRKGGPLRNEQMACEADALIAIWDGRSKGTWDMITRARKHGLKVYIEEVQP